MDKVYLIGRLCQHPGPLTCLLQGIPPELAMQARSCRDGDLSLRCAHPTLGGLCSVAQRFGP